MLLTGLALAGESAPVAANGRALDAVAVGEVRSAPPRQSDASGTDAAADGEPGTASEAGQMATMVAVLNRQGAEGAAILSRVASVDVQNPLPMPEPTIDPGAAQTAAANAAATSTAIAATEVARAVQATVEARATEEAAARRAEARAAATATAAATPAAVTAQTTQPAGAAADDSGTPPASLLGLAKLSLAQGALSWRFLALGPAFAAVLAVLAWRRHREPFVLKAKPVRA